MKAELLNPFIETVRRFTEILGFEQFDKEKVTVTQKPDLNWAVSSIVDVTGPSSGTVILGFSETFASEAISRFCGDDAHKVDEGEDCIVIESMMDVIVQNFLADIMRSTPDSNACTRQITVFNRESHNVPCEGPCLSISFLTDAGKFIIQACARSDGLVGQTEQRNNRE
jgi:CheY-specific phosphatase CheX